MEISTIIGIILACLTMLIGGYWLFRPAKNDSEANTKLNVHPDSQLPIIPRHLRSRLVGNKRPQPTQIDPVNPNQFHNTAEAVQDQTQLAFDLDHQHPVVMANTTQTQQEQSTITHAALAEAQPTTVEASTFALDHVHTYSPSSVLSGPSPAADDAMQLSAFEGQSNLLDAHLTEQQRRDAEADISNAEHVITLKIMANPRRALSGDKALKVMLKYGLRYGELSCFHRHEEPDQDSPLMFSALRITDFGYAGFDLETLSTEQVQGLALFMTFPHAKALTGFDMMSSVAYLIATEIDGRVFDETHREYTAQLKLHWRNHVIDYMAQHPT